MPILRNNQITVNPTPNELARCFCEFDADQQAEFFNSIARESSAWEQPFVFQLQFIVDSNKLDDDGKRIMESIGEYAAYYACD